LWKIQKNTNSISSNKKLTFLQGGYQVEQYGVVVHILLSVEWESPDIATAIRAPMPKNKVIMTNTTPIAKLLKFIL
jgi:hypothetical protein